MYPPTNAPNKIQFITSIKTPICFSTGVHPQGVMELRNISPTH